MQTAQSLSLEDVQAAAERIRPYIHRTPILRCESLDRRTGASLFLKAEHLQKSGSFKIRGALNKLLSLSPEEKKRGVVAFSSGNHAQGVALAARLTGIHATIVMPSDAPRVKLEATADYGAEIVLFDRFREDREAIARGLAQSRGSVLVPPFDDLQVMAGQGTLGLELAQELPDLEVVLIPVGGGGLISGIATALKGLHPSVEVYGVEPEAADDARRSLEQGQIVQIPQPNTVADGVATRAIGVFPFPIMRRLLSGIVTVSEGELVEALYFLLTRTKQVVEPTGALATAAALQQRVQIRGRRVLSLLCGGNVDPRTLSSLLNPASHPR